MAISHARADLLEGRFVRGGHLDVGEERHVVARPHASQVGTQNIVEARASAGPVHRVPRIGEDPHPLALEERRLGGQASGGLELVREALGFGMSTLPAMLGPRVRSG